jgi:alpha-D-ribose 1-methylphosphonate 5-triphosphate synthase subunit PhnL
VEGDMQMNNIDWRGEALEFSKVHNTNREVVIQLVEKAMKHGATLMVIKTTEKLKVVCDDLKKKHVASFPHKQQTKMIEVDKT